MGIRVLVVDDDKDLLTLIERYLVKEHQGFEVTSTISAQDAVRKLEEEQFDVIVCDYYLGVGEMNGLELLEWLRASQSSIPFIMFTGRSREEVAIRALNLGANLYLKKDQEDLGNLFVELVHHIKSSVESLQMEEALRQSELRYHDLLMALPGGIGITDLDENFTYVNQSFSDMLGYSVEELVQKNVLDLTPADDHRIVKAETERRKRYVTSTYDLQMIRKDGELRQFNISTLPQKDDRGNVIGTIGVVSDITERKKAEKALRASEQLLKSTFDSLSEAILVIETDTEEIVNCNPAAETVFGYSRHEMLGQKIGMLHVNQTTQGEFEGNLYPAIEENGSLDQFEFRMKRSDGTVFPTEHSVTPLKNEQGTRVGWVTVIHDITENKLAEEALRESEVRYRSLFDNTPVGLAVQEIVVDESGRAIDFVFIDANEGFEALAGLRKDDIVGKSASHVLTNGGELGLDRIDVYGKVALTGARARFDQYSEALGKWFSVTAYSLENNLFITAYTDVTEQKKAYEDLKQQKKELSDFAHTMSHDLNNYFFKIRGLVHLLESKGENPEIHGIQLLMAEMSNLVQHSIALADAGLVIDKKQKMDLAHLVHDVAARHLPEGIALVQGSLLSVMADEIKLLQIFQNLFRNAVEHGSPTTVEVQRYDSKDGIRIVVANNGKLIPSDLRHKIFQSGFTTKDKGKGYGLSIVKKLVEAHGWQIKLVDAPKTAFEILIPRAAG